MRHPKFWTWIIALLLACLCLCGFILLDDMTVGLEKVDYYSDRLPHPFYGYRILVIADFHDAFYFDQVADIANREKPDMILFLGDMAALSHPNQENVYRLLDSITVDAPIYGVLGNQEVWNENVQAMEAAYRQHGLSILNHEKITIERDGASIDLIGVRDVTDADGNLEGSWLVDQMKVFLGHVIDPNQFTLLACHRANLYPDLRDLKADLMLSGHIHGGIVRIPGVGGLMGADGSLLPEYDKGFFTEGEMDMFVSTGADFRLGKLRVLNGPTVTLLTLKN